MLKLTEEQQTEIVTYVQWLEQQYDEQMQMQFWRLKDIYKEVRSFTQEKEADWETTFKVNKMHEVENKLQSKLMSKRPKWIVSPRIEWIKPQLAALSNEEFSKRMKTLTSAVEPITAYLDHVFAKNDLHEKIRLWAKTGIRYGYGVARTKWKFERVSKEESQEIVAEYPDIEVVPWANLKFDPRYRLLEEMPAVIEIVEWIRANDLFKRKIMNKDKLQEVFEAMDAFENDQRGYKTAMKNIVGIETTTRIDKNAMNLKVFRGYYELKPWQERMYEITIVDDLIPIKAKMIKQYPYEDFKVFEDTDWYFPVGFLEPILWLQQEMNYKKNAAAEYINYALNRELIWSEQSGIDPKQLVSRPWNIMHTDRSGDEARRNLVEMDRKSIDPSFFSEQADFERQIQSWTFTIDVGNRQNLPWTTNTATGERIQFFESNQVIDDIRKKFEDSVSRLGYKILQETYENMAITDNIILRKEWTTQYFKINREAIKNALENYDLHIEAWSTSNDLLETRRQDAIAQYNLGISAAGAGVPINIEKLYRNIIKEFEGANPDDHIQPDIQGELSQWLGRQVNDEEVWLAKEATPDEQIGSPERLGI